jgi:hypothetical protein
MTRVIVEGDQILACVSIPWFGRIDLNLSEHESDGHNVKPGNEFEFFGFWYHVLTCRRMCTKRDWRSVLESVLVKAASAAEVEECAAVICAI